MELSMRFRRIRSAGLATLLGLGSFACVAAEGDGKVELAGSQEVPAVETEAKGTGEIKVSEDGMVTGSVTTTGIEGTAAHIHVGDKGENGPPIITLVKKGDTYEVPPNSKLTAAQMEDFKDRGLYVNVHSAEHPDGEIRDQIDVPGKVG